MDYESALNLLLVQGVGRDDVPLDEALIEDGFLGCLRPYHGLQEENFLQVMDAIIALGPHLRGQEVWETRLIKALWGLTTMARLWGLDPDGMLQRNRILTADETLVLLKWVQCIEMAVLRLLHGDDPASALSYYRGGTSFDHSEMTLNQVTQRFEP